MQYFYDNFSVNNIFFVAQRQAVQMTAGRVAGLSLGYKQANSVQLTC